MGSWFMGVYLTLGECQSQNFWFLVPRNTNFRSFRPGQFEIYPPTIACANTTVPSWPSYLTSKNKRVHHFGPGSGSSRPGVKVDRSYHLIDLIGLDLSDPSYEIAPRKMLVGFLSEKTHPIAQKNSRLAKRNPRLVLELFMAGYTPSGKFT